MDITIITAIIGSSVLAAIVTALFTKLSKDKSDKLQYITNERKQWRDDLRDAIVSLRRLFENKYNKDINNTDCLKFKTYSEVKVYFQVRLNPNDNEDNNILESFDSLNDEKKLQLIEKGVARLLKHDWERAKKETNSQKWYTQFIIFFVILFLIYNLYPIKEWLLIGENVKKDIFSMQSVVVEIFSCKTLLIVFILPIILQLILGVKLWIFKKLSINSKNDSKISSICSWLNIPYRGTIDS